MSITIRNLTSFNRYSPAFAGLVGAIALVFTSSPTFSQTLEEVVVSAQKRDESLQDVSLSVNVLDGAAISDFGIANFDALEVPGVHISQGGMNENVYIRGVGSTGNNFGFEQSVPFFIDGTYLGRARAQKLGFLDVDRIEVLKGPQPIYLGKNAVGGAISIVTRRPSDEPEFSIDLFNEFENEEFSATVAGSAPISDDFRVRGVLKYRDLAKGWVKNASNGEDEPTQEDTMARVSAVWDVSETIEIYAKLEYADNRWEGRNAEAFDCGPTSVVPSLGDTNCRLDGVSYINFDPANYPLNPDTGDTSFPQTRPRLGQTFINDFELFGGQIAIKWDTGSFELASITSFFEFENKHFNKADFVPTDRGSAEFFEDFEQFSQELRLTSTAGTDLSWIAGVYFDSNDNFTDSPNNVPNLAPMSFTQQRVADETADSWAVFGEVAYDLTESVRLKAGARYTEVDKDIDFNWNRWLGAGGNLTVRQEASFEDSRSDSALQPALTLEWRPTSEWMLYASWKEGFKAGGFDHSAMDDFTAFQFDEEEVTAYEAGAKWRSNNGRATVNAALFRNEFDDLQVTSRDPVELTFATLNAAEALTQGIEVEFAFAMTNSITLSGGVVFLDTEYENFAGAQCFTGQSTVDGCIDGEQDLTGAVLQFAPDYSGTLAVDYARPFGDGMEFTARLSMYFTDDFVTDLDQDPSTIVPGYEKFDARLGFGPVSGKWELALIGRNLTDELTTSWRADIPGGDTDAHFGLVDRLRQLAIQARYNF